MKGGGENCFTRRLFPIGIILHLVCGYFFFLIVSVAWESSGFLWSFLLPLHTERIRFGGFETSVCTNFAAGKKNKLRFKPNQATTERSEVPRSGSPKSSWCFLTWPAIYEKCVYVLNMLNFAVFPWVRKAVFWKILAFSLCGHFVHERSSLYRSYQKGISRELFFFLQKCVCS